MLVSTCTYFSRQWNRCMLLFNPGEFTDRFEVVAKCCWGESCKVRELENYRSILQRQRLLQIHHFQNIAFTDKHSLLLPCSCPSIKIFHVHKRWSNCPSFIIYTLRCFCQVFFSLFFMWSIVWLLFQELWDSYIFLAELEHPRTQVVSAVSCSHTNTLNRRRYMHLAQWFICPRESPAPAASFTST